MVPIANAWSMLGPRGRLCRPYCRNHPHSARRRPIAAQQEPRRQMLCRAQQAGTRAAASSDGCDGWFGAGSRRGLSPIKAGRGCRRSTCFRLHTVRCAAKFSACRCIIKGRPLSITSSRQRGPDRPCKQGRCAHGQHHTLRSHGAGPQATVSLQFWLASGRRAERRDTRSGSVRPRIHDRQSAQAAFARQPLFVVNYKRGLRHRYRRVAIRIIAFCIAVG